MTDRCRDSHCEHPDHRDSEPPIGRPPSTIAAAFEAMLAFLAALLSPGGRGEKREKPVDLGPDAALWVRRIGPASADLLAFRDLIQRAAEEHARGPVPPGLAEQLEKAQHDLRVKASLYEMALKDIDRLTRELAAARAPAPCLDSHCEHPAHVSPGQTLTRSEAHRKLLALGMPAKVAADLLDHEPPYTALSSQARDYQETVWPILAAYQRHASAESARTDVPRLTPAEEAEIIASAPGQIGPGQTPIGRPLPPDASLEERAMVACQAYDETLGCGKRPCFVDGVARNGWLAVVRAVDASNPMRGALTAVGFPAQDGETLDKTFARAWEWCVDHAHRAQEAVDASRPTPALDREKLGRLVREVWIEWAREQPNPKASWLAPWWALSEPDREVDRRIGERIAQDALRYVLGDKDSADPDRASDKGIAPVELPPGREDERADAVRRAYENALSDDPTMINRAWRAVTFAADVTRETYPSSPARRQLVEDELRRPAADRTPLFWPPSDEPASDSIGPRGSSFDDAAFGAPASKRGPQ